MVPAFVASSALSTAVRPVRSRPPERPPPALVEAPSDPRAAFAEALRRRDEAAARRHLAELSRVAADAPTDALVELAMGRYERVVESAADVALRAGALTLLGRDADAAALMAAAHEEGSDALRLDRLIRAEARGDHAASRAEATRWLDALRVAPADEREASARALGRALVTAGMTAELRVLVDAEASRADGSAWVRVHAAPLLADPALLEAPMPPALRRVAEIYRRELEGDPARAVAGLEAALSDPRVDDAVLLRLALARNLAAVGRLDAARRACEALSRPARYRPTVLTAAATCRRAAWPGGHGDPTAALVDPGAR